MRTGRSWTHCCGSSPLQKQKWHGPLLRRGRGGQVNSFIGFKPARWAAIKPEFLKEITFLAYHAKAHSVAADAARRLVAARGNDSDRMLMAEVFTAAGLPWLGASSRRSLFTVSPWGPT